MSARLRIGAVEPFNILLPFRKTDGVCAFVLSVLMGLFLLCAPAFAQIATKPCNPAILAQMNAKAVQHTMQESVQNQSFVVRTDSVLEYSCFMRQTDLSDMGGKSPVGLHLAPVFSENTHWGTLHDDMHTDRILTQVVTQPLQAYIPGQFPPTSTYLGGRSVHRGCDKMAKVWHEAKCRNFGTDPGEWYFSFEQYALIADPRIKPTPSCAKPDWGTYNAAAATSATWQAPFRTEIQTTFTNVNNTLKPGACGAPIPLNIQVKMENTTAYNDAFCIKPGCVYNPDSNTCQ